MIAEALKRAGLTVIVDTRARNRRGMKPAQIVVEHYDAESTADLVDALVASGEIPMAVVSRSGRILVMSGQSGVIVVEGSTPNEAQTAALSKAVDVLSEAFGIAKPKKRRATKPVEYPELDVTELVAQVREDWADMSPSTIEALVEVADIIATVDNPEEDK